ncbi:alpha-amylase family glycosyl hydrolase [Colwellia sp. MEBiC06753]
MMIKPPKMTLAIIASLLTLGLTGCNGDSTKPSVNTTPSVATELEPITTQPIPELADLPHYLTRDVRDEVFYFVLPDRFHNGDTSNDQGSKTIAISQGGLDKTKKGHFHGGDVPGLTEKIPYLKNMGITAIWLTPILRNQAVQGDITGYHGYWVLDFTEIDPHLGTNADLKQFIDTAHSNNIRVFFDIITNHTADVIKYQECHGATGVMWSDSKQLCQYKTLAQVAAGDTYTPFIPKGQEQLKKPLWLNNPKYYHNQGDSTFEGENSIYGDFFGLDDTNTDDPAVVNGMVDIFKNIIDEFKPDGFRIDTVKHVNIEFWQQFTPALMAHAQSIGLPKFFIFGEVYSGDPNVLSNFTTVGKIPSVLDFGFQGAVRNVLVEQQGTNKLVELFNQDDKYQQNNYNQPYDANYLLNFIGNHDMGRFAWMLKASVHNYTTEESLARVKLAHAMMYFLRGMPVVYYGSEQGFVGDGGNHDSRQDMMPSLVASYNDDVLLGTSKTTADDNFDQSHPLYQAFTEMAKIYQANDVLKYGKQTVVYSSDKAELFAVIRALDSGQRQLVLFNTANKTTTTSFNFDHQISHGIYDTGSSQYSLNDGHLTIAMSPLSVTIIELK